MDSALTVNINELFLTKPQEAFQVIYMNHYQNLCERALKITTSSQAAEDIVQEVIVQLWNKKDEFEKDFNVLGYLNRSVYYRALNYLKSKYKHTDDESTLVNYEDESKSIENEIYYNELSEEISKAIEELPEKCKAVFVLSRFDGKSYLEIADILGISTKTVENHISKALFELRKKLRSYENK